MRSDKFQVNGGERRVLQRRVLRIFPLQTPRFQLPANHPAAGRAKQTQFPSRAGRAAKCNRAKQSQLAARAQKRARARKTEGLRRGQPCETKPIREGMKLALNHLQEDSYVISTCRIGSTKQSQFAGGVTWPAGRGGPIPQPSGLPLPDRAKQSQFARERNWR